MNSFGSTVVVVFEYNTSINRYDFEMRASSALVVAVLGCCDVLVFKYEKVQISFSLNPGKESEHSLLVRDLNNKFVIAQQTTQSQQHSYS